MYDEASGEKLTHGACFEARKGSRLSMRGYYMSLTLRRIAPLRCLEGCATISMIKTTP